MQPIVLNQLFDTVTTEAPGVYGLKNQGNNQYTAEVTYKTNLIFIEVFIWGSNCNLLATIKKTVKSEQELYDFLVQFRDTDITSRH